MNSVKSQSYARQKYELIKQMVGDKSVVNQGILRVIADAAVAASNAFSFDFSDTKSRKEDAEILLQKSDDFIATGGAFGLVKVPRANNVNDWSKWELQTFANPDVFGANYAQYETMWAGKMDFKTGTVTRFDNLPTSVFRHVPCFEQFTVGANTVNIARDVHGAEIFDFEPYILLKGNDTHKVAVNVPSISTSLAQANFAIYAVVELHGYKIEDLRETR